jgi:hypothetical protein
VKSDGVAVPPRAKRCAVHGAAVQKCGWCYDSGVTRTIMIMVGVCQNVLAMLSLFPVHQLMSALSKSNWLAKIMSAMGVSNRMSAMIGS